jgi:hypothetical protein
VRPERGRRRSFESKHLNVGDQLTRTGTLPSLLDGRIKQLRQHRRSETYGRPRSVERRDVECDISAFVSLVQTDAAHMLHAMSRVSLVTAVAKVDATC